MKEENYKYFRLKKDDYKEVSKLHSEAFSNFFLSSLGPSFLNTYYSSVLRDKDSISVGVSNGNKEIIGFAVGCVQSEGFHKKIIKRNIIKFGLQFFRLIILKPLAIIRLAKNLKKESNKNDDGRYAELLSICISPKYKSKGLGKELIKNFENELIGKGCKLLTLTTDFHNNDKTINFYKSTGYEIFYTFISYPKRKMYKLIKEL